MMKRIGIDIGGTQLRIAAFEENGALVCKEVLHNDQTKGPEQNLDRLIAALKGWGIEYEGIGIGCPGPLDFKTGRILTPPNIPAWKGFPIVDYMSEATGHRVVLNNDANVAGLAEALRGAGRGCDSVFYFTVSTGVGGAYVYQGHIVGGAHSCAAEVFNIVVNERPSVRPGSVCRRIPEGRLHCVVCISFLKAKRQLGKRRRSVHKFQTYARCPPGRVAADAPAPRGGAPPPRRPAGGPPRRRNDSIAARFLASPLAQCGIVLTGFYLGLCYDFLIRRKGSSHD